MPMALLSTLLDQASRLHPSQSIRNLDSCYHLLSKLGNPHLKLPPILHVAGTNGKGSTLAFCKTLFEDQGYTVHRFTSPHLIHFNERIELCGIPVSDEYLIDGLIYLLKKNANQPISTFCFITCLAFWFFARVPADIVLLETGMGGRLDPTNVVWPRVVGITSLSYDHTHELGVTLKNIALEKAGIIKPYVPIVTGHQQDDAMAVLIKTAQQCFAHLRIANDYQGPLGLKGHHQKINAGLALTLVAETGLIKPNPFALAQTSWPGRLQHFEYNVYVDGAHNPDALSILAQNLYDIHPQKWCVVLHIKKTKDTKACLDAIAPNASRVIYIEHIDGGDESACVSDIKQYLDQKNIGMEHVISIHDAMLILKKTKEPVVITGSLFLVGAWLKMNM